MNCDRSRPKRLVLEPPADSPLVKSRKDAGKHVEQFATAVLGIADVAANMLPGEVTAIGTPSEIESELSSAYLGV